MERTCTALGHPPGFFEPLKFTASPLYASLCPVVAGSGFLSGLARQAPAGQRPEFLFFAAVHHLLLSGVQHPLADFFPSVVGDGARPPELAGAALVSFCGQFREDVLDIIRTRSVQTNHVRRSVALRAGLAVIAPHVDQPVDVIEVGASAGLLLGFRRYGYRLHRDDVTTRFGDADSPLQIDCEVLGRHPLPDLDQLPPIDSVTGVDRRPVDPTDRDSRAWLAALVWPEDAAQRQLLGSALDLTTRHRPDMIAGDAIDVLPDLGAALPRGHCRVVFHCATRIHVPQWRLRAFDAAIRTLGESGPLWEIAIEDSSPNRPPHDGNRAGMAMTITDPAGEAHVVAYVNGHLRWIEPCSSALSPTAGPSDDTAPPGRSHGPC